MPKSKKENSKIINLDEFKKSQALKELQEERAAIQSEHLYQPPSPKKSQKRPLLDRWLDALDASVPKWDPPDDAPRGSDISLGRRMQKALEDSTPYPPPEKPNSSESE